MIRCAIVEVSQTFVKSFLTGVERVKPFGGLWEPGDIHDGRPMLYPGWGFDFAKNLF